MPTCSAPRDWIRPAPPKTWSELTADAAKLKDPAKNVFGFGFSAMQAEEGVFQWLPFLYQAGGSIDHLDAPEAAQSLQLLVDFVKSGSASLDVLNQRQYEVTNTFMAGNTAMVHVRAMGTAAAAQRGEVRLEAHAAAGEGRQGHPCVVAGRL